MKHAKETIFTQFRCTRRVVLTFSHFITGTGKQISTYHQGSAVNNDTKSVFLLFLQGTQKSGSRSVLLLSTYMMSERFGDNLTVTTSDISKLTHFPPEYYVFLLLYNPLVVYLVKNGMYSIHSRGVPQTSLQLPPGYTVKVYSRV